MLDLVSKATVRLVQDTYGTTELSRRQVRKLLADGHVIADALSKVIRITRTDTVTISDESLEAAIRNVTGNIIARSARENNVRGGRIRTTGSQ